MPKKQVKPIRPGSKDPNEELRNALKRKNELEGIPMPNAMDELAPPGASFKVPGGWDIARGKRPRRKGRIDYA